MNDPRDLSATTAAIIKTMNESRPEFRAFEDLQEQVKGFENGLSDTLEIGMSVSGAASVIHVERITRSGHMIVFDGTDNQRRRARLIQHFSQVNVQMLAVDKLAEEANRIGFYC